MNTRLIVRSVNKRLWWPTGPSLPMIGATATNANVNVAYFSSGPAGRPRVVGQQASAKLGLPKKTKAMNPRPGDPQFREIWRKFQLRVHPDLFSQYPDLQAKNNESLQRLQGILNEAKTSEGRSAEELLKPRIEHLEFFVRTNIKSTGQESGSPRFLRVPITIRIPGNNCQHVLAEALSELFSHCGLPSRFHWGSEYWNSTYVVRPEASEQEYQ